MRDKQIEEMAKEIREVTEATKLITDRYGNAYGYRRVGVSDPKQIAEHLIENKGYRKSTDLAREIFEEIEASAKVKYWRGGGLVVFEIDGEDFAELKKKYTESEDTE